MLEDVKEVVYVLLECSPGQGHVLIHTHTLYTSSAGSLIGAVLIHHISLHYV